MAAELTQLTDEDLLSRPDGDAFAEFYCRHARKLAGYLMRATADAEAAADLTAETFAAALSSRSRYRPERGAPTTWLYGIAAHKLADWRRRGQAEDRARRRLRLERPPLSEDDVLELDRLAGDVTVAGFLAELPPDQRQVLRARLVDERAYGEIAQQEGVSEGAIRQRVSRGVHSLRRLMGGQG